MKLESRWVTSKMNKTAGSLVLKQDKFLYIPIIQTLQQIIKNDSIRNEVVTCSVQRS